MDGKDPKEILCLHKVLEKSLETVVSHMNKTDMEWLQLCSLANKNTEKAADADEGFEMKVEDHEKINNTPIFVNVKTDLNASDVEEFDSD